MCSTSSASTSSSSDVPALGVLGQQRADGVGDLPASAVADREVHRGPRPVAGVLLGLLEDGDRLGRQQLQRAHRAQAASGGRARARSSATPSMIRSSGVSSGSGRREVVGGQQEQRDDLRCRPRRTRRGSRRSCPRPRRWPSLTSSRPMARAQRRLPSMITPTWQGLSALSSARASRRSYTWMSASRTTRRAPTGVTLGPAADRRAASGAVPDAPRICCSKLTGTPGCRRNLRDRNLGA